MQAYEVIVKKRDGLELTTEEINYFIRGLSTGEIPDYQVSAMTMAIYFRGMTSRELSDWTMAMVNSGATMDLSEISGIKADKHSSGGVGDKTTILLAPWIAACGVPIAKMSGRGLGHTGGTIDKLEAIPGFQTSLSKEQFIKNVNEIGVAVAGQTGNLVPADKKLYAIRDVTGTVDSIPLIASSIMSKKIAAGADAIVLDVKVGSGAFMKSVEDAKALAKAMVSIGTSLNRNTVAIISNMNQPLGNAVGNAIEVVEAIEALKGNGPEDLMELMYALGSQMLIVSGKIKTLEEGTVLMQEILKSGAALEKLKEMIRAQGGDANVVEDYTLLPQAGYTMEIPAPETGYISDIMAQEIGLAVKIIGAGREKMDDVLDLSSGVYLKKKVGDHAEKGEPIAILYGNNTEKMQEASLRIQKAYGYSTEKLPVLPMIHAVITKEDLENE